MKYESNFELKVDALSCVRGTSLIFKGIEFTLKSGQAMVLQGPNGSGKSSLLRVLAGLAPAFSGKIDYLYIDDVSSETEPLFVEDTVSYIGHENPIKSPLTIEENIQSWAGLYGLSKAESLNRVTHALTVMGLYNVRKLSGRVLSSGQKRRLTLSRLFIEQKPIWILDEPTVGLDQYSCHLLENEIKKHLAIGGIVLLSTHVGIELENPVFFDITAYSRLSHITSVCTKQHEES